MAFPYTNEESLIWNCILCIVYIFFISDHPTSWICLECFRKLGVLLGFCVSVHSTGMFFFNYVCLVGDISLMMCVSVSYQMLIVKLELNFCVD